MQLCQLAVVFVFRSTYLFCVLLSFCCGSCPWASLALRVHKFTRFMSGNPLVRFWAPLCCQESDMIDVIFPTSKFLSVGMHLVVGGLHFQLSLLYNVNEMALLKTYFQM
jgi:hypothetical protein